MILGNASGETLYLSNCEFGGSVTVDSSDFSYNPSRWDFSIIFRFNDCGVEGETVNGSSTISGHYETFSETLAQIYVSSELNGTITEDGNSRTFTCNGTISGIYDFSTEVFDGNSNITNCSSSGKKIREGFVGLLMTGPIDMIP